VRQKLVAQFIYSIVIFLLQFTVRKALLLIKNPQQLRFFINLSIIIYWAIVIVASLALDQYDSHARSG